MLTTISYINSRGQCLPQSVILTVGAVLTTISNIDNKGGWLSQTLMPPMLVDTSDFCKYVAQSGSAAMLANKRLAGVTPEVDLGKGTQARRHASESTLALKPMADVTRSLKQGYQWPNKKDMCLLKNLKKKEKGKKTLGGNAYHSQLY